MAIRLNDEVYIITSASLSNDDYCSLALLYQPIIGNEAYALYMTLLALLDRSNKKSIVTLQKNICDILNKNTIQFENIRKILEGIGLLNTYVKEDYKYVYALKQPLTPSSFLNDGILGSVLKSKIGDELYKKLVQRFKIEKFEKKGYENITVSFDDCFKGDYIDIEKEMDVISKKQSGVKVKSNFNIDLFLKKVSNWIKEENITEGFKKEVSSLANLYDLSVDDMKKVVLKCCDNNKYFKNELLVEKTLEYKQNLSKNKITFEVRDDIKLVHENKSRELIKRRCGRVLDSEIQMIDELLAKTGFESDVMNKLIEYVLDMNNNIMPNAKYFEKVAADWIQKNIRNMDDVNRFLNEMEAKKNNKKNKNNDLEELMESYRKVKRRGELDE